MKTPDTRDGNKPNPGRKQQRRNGHAFHPIMSKGGAHEKSNKAKRKAARQQTNLRVREWPGHSVFTHPQTIKKAA